MNTQTDILHLLRNLIRTGTVNALDLENALCRVETGDNLTDCDLPDIFSDDFLARQPGLMCCNLEHSHAVIKVKATVNYYSGG